MSAHFPLIGILASILLLLLAATYYPGGTAQSPSTVGYNWAQNFISTLFSPTAFNGAANPARRVAIPAWFVLCFSVALIFRNISRKGTSKFQKKAIEIGGVGAAVYAFLVVTPMHNLLVTISLLFFIPAVLAVLHLLYVEHQMKLLWAGVICFILLTISAAMYYGNALWSLLPVAQKLTVALYLGWLVALQYASSGKRYFRKPGTSR